MDPAQMAAAAGGIVGKILDYNASKKAAKMNYKMQKEFAQHGIRWKVEDAKAAGLHPLAALGVQMSGYNPVSSSSNFGDMGQDIGRAIDATRTGPERDEASGTLGKLALERAGLQNDLLRAQIAKLNQAGQPPARPTTDERFMVGGSAVPGTLVQDQPLKRVVTDPTKPGQDPGSVSDVAWTRHPDGSYHLVPSKDAKQLMEDQWLPQLQWGARNFLPYWRRDVGPPFKAPRGFAWKGDVWRGYDLVRALPQ